MPQVTVYVRVDDLDTWKSIKKKSEFIHNALSVRAKAEYGEVIKIPFYKPDKLKQTTKSHPPKSHVDPDMLP